MFDGNVVFSTGLVHAGRCSLERVVTVRGCVCGSVMWGRWDMGEMGYDVFVEGLRMDEYR